MRWIYQERPGMNVREPRRRTRMDSRSWHALKSTNARVSTAQSGPARFDALNARHRFFQRCRDPILSSEHASSVESSLLPRDFHRFPTITPSPRLRASTPPLRLDWRASSLPRLKPWALSSPGIVNSWLHDSDGLAGFKPSTTAASAFSRHLQAPCLSRPNAEFRPI